MLVRPPNSPLVLTLRASARSTAQRRRSTGTIHACHEASTR
jgi:hypothetical protein